MPHLLVDISAHGFGHLAQTAPVLNALRARVPALHLTIRCALPHATLVGRVAGDFAHLTEASDFGMLMHDAVTVDAAASCARYAAFHADWEARVAAEARRLKQIAPDALLANVSYLALAGAAAAQVPAWALCSLNWAEIFFPYCRHEPDAARIRAQMQAAYASARAFLRVTPGMAMRDLANVREIGPVGRTGTNRRERLTAQLGLDADARLVLVAMGGIAQAFDPARWPRHPKIFWIAPRESGLVRTDVIALESLSEDFADLIASCDAVLTKSGYGSFVEAAAAGTRILYVRRPDWPEEPCLVAWLDRFARAQSITRDALDAGTFLPALLQLLDLPRAAPVPLSGVDAAADTLARALAAGEA